jgi:beta-lactamase regulating signal transducer with metallopeptidase domain
MNGLDSALVWSAIQITMVASAALVIERWASWRGPRAGSWVASASIWLVIILSPLPFCQPSLGWTWQLATNQSAASALSLPARGGVPTRTAAQGDDRKHSNGQDSLRGLVVPFSWLRSVRDSLAQQADTIRQGRSWWSRAWVFLVLAGTAWSLLRLLLGLWGVRDCRRRSVPVDDPELLDLVETLRCTLNFPRPVEIRELPNLMTTTAAAVGWRRPLVLLPANWRTWTESERRAVVAHELAHIARADYAAGVVARLGLALHFYHPLMHWIVARLRLQQELAADAQGARLAGGRRSYVLSLSRLALRQEGSLPVWPAKAFLPARGHLIRRIHVLNEKATAKDGSLSTTARAVTIASLLAVGIVAAALRGPSSTQGAEPPQGTANDIAKPVVRSAPNTSAKPFDLSYIPTKPLGFNAESFVVQGFVAVRPAATFQLPGVKPYLDALNATIDKVLPKSKLRAEMIEQATVGFSVQSRDRRAGKPGRIMFGGFMVRTVDDFDWKSATKEIIRILKEESSPSSDLIEVSFEGGVYYKTPKIPALGPEPACLYFPDARTVVHLGEPQIRNLIQHRGAVSCPEYVQGSDWRKVENGLAAIALDNRDERWKLDLESDEPEDLHLTPLLQNATRWILGVDGGDAMVLRAIATCGTDQKGETVARSLQALLAGWRTALKEAGKDLPQQKQKVKGLARSEAKEVAKDLLEACQIHREGVRVEVSTKAHLPLQDLEKFLGEVGF